MINKIFYKYQPIIIQFVVLVVSIAVLILVLVPQFKDYWSNRGQAEVINQKSDSIKTNVSILKGIDQAEVDRDLNLVLTVLPKDAKASEAVTVLQNYVSLSGLSIDTYSFNNTQKTLDSSFKLNFAMTGNIQNLSNFLKKLNQVPLVVTVDSITIGGTGGVLQSEIPIVVYYSPTASGSVPNDQTLLDLTDDEKKLIANIQQNITNQTTTSADNPATIITGKTDPFN